MSFRKGTRVSWKNPDQYDRIGDLENVPITGKRRKGGKVQYLLNGGNRWVEETDCIQWVTDVRMKDITFHREDEAYDANGNSLHKWRGNIMDLYIEIKDLPKPLQQRLKAIALKAMKERT